MLVEALAIGGDRAALFTTPRRCAGGSEQRLARAGAQGGARGSLPRRRPVAAVAGRGSRAASARWFCCSAAGCGCTNSEARRSSAARRAGAWRCSRAGRVLARRGRRWRAASARPVCVRRHDQGRAPQAIAGIVALGVRPVLVMATTRAVRGRSRRSSASPRSMPNPPGDKARGSSPGLREGRAARRQGRDGRRWINDAPAFGRRRRTASRWPPAPTSGCRPPA